LLRTNVVSEQPLFANNGEITQVFLQKTVLFPVKVSFFTEKRYFYRVCAFIAACILKTLRARPFSPEQFKNAEIALYFQHF